MAITSRKITTYAKNIVDLSDQPNKDGLTAAQLKAFFDSRTDGEVKTSINGIVDDLVATTDGASGADQIGATPLTGGTGNTVQEVLEEIDGSTVHNAGDETVAGVKTFSSSPIVPAPTTDTQAATKKYVDDADALKVDITDIVNDLTTGGTAVPLSAEQGKTLQGEVGTLASLSTTEKGSLVGAINEVDDHADTNATSIGTLASLTTTEKTNLVGAINEVDADVGTNATAIGTLASLTTTEKTNLVGAINELDTDKVETSAITNTLTETAAGKVLDARQGKALSDKIGTQTFTEDNYVTDGQSATASIDALDQAVKDNADLISTKFDPVAAYTHTGNKEAVISAVDVDTDTFTSTAHGFADGDKIYPILNWDAGLVYPLAVYAGGLTQKLYYVINKTDNTFQVSETSGGSAVNLTANATIDLTKWHFELPTVRDIEITGLSGYKYRVIVHGKTPTENQSIVITPNSTYEASYMSLYTPTAAPYGYPYNGLLGGSVGYFCDMIIDFVGRLKIHGTVSTINSGNTTTNKTGHTAYYNEHLTKKETLITSIDIRLNTFHINGTKIEVYDYE